MGESGRPPLPCCCFVRYITHGYWVQRFWGAFLYLAGRSWHQKIRCTQKKAPGRDHGGRRPPIPWPRCPSRCRLAVSTMVASIYQPFSIVVSGAGRPSGPRSRPPTSKGPRTRSGSAGGFTTTRPRNPQKRSRPTVRRNRTMDNTSSGTSSRWSLLDMPHHGRRTRSRPTGPRFGTDRCRRRAEEPQRQPQPARRGGRRNRWEPIRGGAPVCRIIQVAGVLAMDGSASCG